MTPADDKNPKVVKVPEFGIADIPAAMDGLKWKEGARFMRKWFTGEPYVLPKAYKSGQGDDRQLRGTPHLLDDADIDDLCSRSPRFKAVVDEVLGSFAGEHLESNDYIGMQDGFFDHLQRSTLVFLRRLNRLGLLDAGAGKFKEGDYDFSDLDGIDLDQKTQFTFRAIGSSFWEKATDALDDVYGAFGALTLKFAATKFRLYEHAGYQTVLIDRVGMYVRDTYDFIGDEQLLGYWCKSGVIKPSMWAWTTDAPYIDSGGKRYYRITNKHFNDYRNKHGKGGDFMVYTNVKQVATSIQFHLSSVDFQEFKDRDGK
ncbi:hypothetical protein XocBAI20_12120 [Xanthomonas oryzae pv. oryzicola]|nr:hypothetical protein XocBAI20_12120 [Xanthomonas oryzae pv. oryzicola]